MLGRQLNSDAIDGDGGNSIRFGAKRETYRPRVGIGRDSLMSTFKTMTIPGRKLWLGPRASPVQFVGSASPPLRAETVPDSLGSGKGFSP